MLALGVICFVTLRADTYLEACTIGDNRNTLDHNLSMKTEWRIIFQRGDFIKFHSKNDIVVGSIKNIFVHEVLESQLPTTVKETRDNSGQWGPAIHCWSTSTGGQDIWEFGNHRHWQCKGWRQVSVNFTISFFFFRSSFSFSMKP